MEAGNARVRLRRTGGVAGVPVEATVDTATLSPDEAAPILAALDAARLDSPGLARMQDAAPPQGPPDAFGYELEVTRGARTWTLRFGDRDVPEALRPLVDLLGSRADPARR